MSRARKHWGWGYADEQPPPAALRAQAAALSGHLGFGSLEPQPPAALPPLPAPRLAPPPAPLGALCDASDATRARHALGSSYGDVVRGFRGEFAAPPDVVVHPTSELDVERVLEWALGVGAAVIPYGGGTSVVGGVEPRGLDGYAGVVTVDLTKFDRVLDVDRTSLAARIQAGAAGPVLEAQLALHGLTLRFYPQSFELATLGGWIATRAAGHFATGPVHIDDLVESVRALTPAGRWASRRLPGSGAGVSPDRLLLGSEGALGLITEAWVRVRPRPTRRASAAVRFPSFTSGAAAVREIVQSGARPANCRLIDAGEARLTGAGDGRGALLVLGFESAGAEVDPALAAARRICESNGGQVQERAAGAERAAGETSWREAFLRAPYLRDTLVAIGVLSETFETAVTWERLDGFVETVGASAREAVRQACGAGSVTCRLTHAYPDGAAPYFTVLAPVTRGDELAAWARGQARCLRGDPRRRRHDHPPSRGRSRSPAVVRPPAS